MRKQLYGTLGLLSLSFAAFAEDAGIAWKEDFETKPPKWNGVHDVQKTFNGSKGAMHSVKLPDNTWFGAELRFEEFKEPVFKITDKTMFNICYFVTTAEHIKMQFQTDDAQIGNISYGIAQPKAGEWAVTSVKMTDFKSGGGSGPNAKVGLGIKSMGFLHGNPKSDSQIWIDNVIVTEGPMPADLDKFVKEKKAESEAAKARLEAERNAQALNVNDHKALFSAEIAQSLKRAWKKDGVTEKTVLNAGADAAKSFSHWTPLTKKELSGTTLIDKMAGTIGGGEMDKIKLRACEAINKHKPEVVTILPGVDDFKRGKALADIVTPVGELLDAVLQSGAVPVLYTPAVPASGAPAVLKAYNDLAAEIRKLATSRRVPLVDAFAVLNPDGNPSARLVSGSWPTTAGYEAIDKVSLLVYQKLEQWVFERREKEIVVAGAPALLPGLTTPPAKTEKTKDKKSGKLEDEE